MFDNIEKLELLDVLCVESGKNKFYNDRFSHAFVFKSDGCTKYNFNGKTFTLSENELLFIPKGSSYEADEVIHGKSIVINFNADIKASLPKIYYTDGFSQKNTVLERLINLWLFGDSSEHYKCFSIFYDILAFVTKIESSQYTYKHNFPKIENAVKYIQEHIFDPNLKINDLHFQCGISDTYFRKIFKASFGITPQEYIITKRLAQARSIIVNGDFNSISEVALSVGYTDPLYFSRIFSKKFGVCPSQYKEC